MDPSEVLTRLEASRPGDAIGYTSAAEAMWDLLHHPHCVLPKLVLYIRFFVNAGRTISYNNFFVVHNHDMALFASGDDHGLDKQSQEQLWRLVMGSRLSEWTGCGHFASVMRHNLYFVSREEEERAAALSPITTPARLLAHLDPARSASNDAEKGLVIRVEFSTYDADAWEQWSCDVGPKPDARDFHAYLIDIPSAAWVRDHDDGDDGGDQAPAAYVVQSLWEHYDVSVRPISARDLRRHLRFLALFDGRKRMANSERCRLTHPSFWDVPLPRTQGRPRQPRPRSSHHSSLEPYLGEGLDPLLERLESQLDQEAHVNVDDVVVSVLDVFSVAAYDGGETKDRLASYLRQARLADGGTQQTLPYGLPNLASSAGPPRRRWSEVLQAVERVHAATEAKQKKAGKKGGGRILPLVDYLPSPHLDTKRRYWNHPPGDDVAVSIEPDDKRGGESKGCGGGTKSEKQRGRCTLS